MKPTQYAYQPVTSSDLALNDLNRLISKSLEHDEMAIAVFVDIEEAFNNANTTSICNVLAKISVPLVLCQWINTKLEETIIASALGETTLRVGATLKESLSPLLWLGLVTDKLSERLQIALTLVQVVHGGGSDSKSKKKYYSISLNEKY